MRKIINILNLTNSVYNFNNNGSKTEKKWQQNYSLRMQSIIVDDQLVMQTMRGI